MVTLVIADEDGMKCLQTSYDRALGPYSDLSRLDDKEAAKFATCDGNDPDKLQRFILRGLAQSGFILQPL